MSRLERWGLPAAAFGLYWLCRGAYYVGFFNDDAFYIIGARSLLSGRYVQLNVPGAPPLIQYLPGASLMLLPAAVFAGKSLWPYQLACAAMAAAALALLADAWRGRPRGLRLASLAVFALSPLAVSMSATVLSDVPLLLLTALAMSLSSRRWESARFADWLPLLAVLALAALARPTGVLVGAAAALALAYEGRWRPSLWCAAAVGLPLGLWLARNRILTGVELTYVGEWLDAYRAAGRAPGLFPLWGNLSFYLRFVLMTSLLRWPGPWKLLEAGTVGLGLVCLGYGMKAPPGEPERSWELWPKLLVPLFFAVHLLWSKQAGRYAYPVLPLCAAYWLRGAGELSRRAGRPRAWGWAALAAASVGLSLSPDARILRASLWESNGANAAPAQTALWMREHARPEDVFAAELDGRWHLLSGRSVVHLPRVYDAGELAAWLRARGARYVLTAEGDSIMRTRGGLSVHDPTPPELLSIFLSDGARYRLVYSNEREGTRIYGRL